MYLLKKQSHSKSDRRFALQLLHLPEVKPRKEDLKNNIKKKTKQKKDSWKNLVCYLINIFNFKKIQKHYLCLHITANALQNNWMNMKNQNQNKWTKKTTHTIFQKHVFFLTMILFWRFWYSAMSNFR